MNYQFKNLKELKMNEMCSKLHLWLGKKKKKIGKSFFLNIELSQGIGQQCAHFLHNVS